ncbi:winged helix DNA-binding domain-containing protein [Ornithinimicrobium cavernae]|uniref:winged helix DNA-binding domain-containing protein n=1 Tax=Ornithinimicrobium cavernae TaxID=2666047 RepID=UPI001379BFEE|nr:winged helix DNA-binding domain-containing protein [Ornithinimicrobium cavernae]
MSVRDGILVGMWSGREVALLRIVAQGLAGPRRASPLEVVRHLGAAQAQDLPGALTSVALRVAGGTRAGVVAALDAGELVRSWPMRGTLHLVPGADLGWMLAVTSPRRVHTGGARRRQLGIDDATIATAREIALEVVSGRAVSRSELLGAWSAAGLGSHPQAGIHLLGQLCQEALLVLGPMQGTEQLIVLLHEHVPEHHELDREDGLAELARRFFTSHGPCTERDLARWGSLTLADTRVGIEGARAHLASIQVEGTEHLMAPDLPDLLAEHRAQARRLMLLPGFDELVLGYADRSFLVPPAHAEVIVPGNNGMFRPTMVKNGVVIGTWKRPSASRPRFEPEPLGDFGPRLRAAAERAFAELP